MADVILDAYKQHELSWNREAYLCERESWKREWDKREHGDYEYFLGPDPSQYYHYDMEQCFQTSCVKFGVPFSFARLLGLANYWYNDLYDWAKRNTNS